MPKVKINATKGLVQESGSGTIIDAVGSPINFAPAVTSTNGIHVYQEEVDLAGVTPTGTDDGVLAYLSKALPAQSVILTCAAQVTELGSTAALDVDVGLTATSDTSIGSAASSETGLITSIAMDASDTVNVCKGLSTATAVAAKTSVIVYNDGTSNTTSALTSGKLLITIVYAGSAAAS